MKITNALLFLATLLLFSCSSTDQEIESSDESFIFGVGYGECLGNCAHLLSYTNGEVYRDEMDRLELTNLAFSNTNESSLLPLAQKIRAALPQELIDSNIDTYGCPDCADQGTIFLQISTESTSRNWLLDTSPGDDWSNELKEFVELINGELEEIIVP